MIQTIHTRSAQQATAAQRERTAIIATVHSLIMMDHQANIDECMAAISEGTNSIIQNTAQARARNSNARQDANDNDDDGDDTQQQQVQMQPNIQ